jgi:hypothetical protein
MMESIPRIPRTVRDLDERYSRIARGALFASLLLHLLIFGWFRADVLIPPSPFAAAGPRAGDDRAAPGGGTEVVTLRSAQASAPEVAAPQPVPVPVEAPKPQIEVRLEEPKPQVVAGPVRIGTGTGVDTAGRGGGAGAGIPGGTGRGDGGTGEEGLFRAMPPSPRGLILPPSDRPGRVRGQEIDVWVFVDHQGKVVSDSTRLDPSTTGDRKFDDRLKKQAAEWVFEPARRGGRVIAEWFRYTIVL